MKSRQLFFVIALCISAFSQAQVSTLYQGDSAIVKGVITEEGGYLLKNYDNDSYWSRLGDYYVNYDDSLNILNTRTINNAFAIKYDNKLFSFDASYHIEGDTIEGGTILNPYSVMDSAFLISYDFREGNFKRIRLPRNAIANAYSFTFLKENNLFAVISAELYTRGSTVDDTNLCLTLIDTAGNIINHRIYDQKITNFLIIEQGNNILVNSTPSQMYYIDKGSLDIVDSMDLHKYMFLSSANDSILIGTAGDYLYKQNTISKTLDSTSFRRANIVPSYNLLSDFSFPNDWSITIKNTDTVIYCYRVCNNTLDTELGIAIENFGLNLLFNGRYTFNDFEPTQIKSVYGVIYTNDGGIILNITTSDNPYASSNAYLLKFYPNGTSNIVSINPDKVVIMAYPNPTKDYINISSSSLIKEIQFYNTLGQEVYYSTTNNKYKQIDVSNFSKGNYIAKIHTDNGDVTKKFIVE